MVEKHHEKHSQQCQLLSASRDGVIRLWRPDSLLHTHTLHTGRTLNKNDRQLEKGRTPTINRMHTFSKYIPQTFLLNFEIHIHTI